MPHIHIKRVHREGISAVPSADEELIARGTLAILEPDTQRVRQEHVSSSYEYFVHLPTLHSGQVPYPTF